MNQLNETDYGTPQRVSETEVTLEIDGVAVTVPAGTSVMRAAVRCVSSRASTSVAARA